MAFSREDNWLAVQKNVELNERIEESIAAVRPHFARANHKATVTSGYRSPHTQVFQAILPNAKKAHIDTLFPEFVQGIAEQWQVGKKVDTPEGNLYWWHRTWSRLLNKNYIVNPPLESVCLYNSFRADGSNRKDTLIRQTPHSRGSCYDIGGGKNYSPNDEYAILLQAKQDPATLIVGMMLETMNDCVHVDIKPV